jgi:hypothetical protein
MRPPFDKDSARCLLVEHGCHNVAYEILVSINFRFDSAPLIFISTGISYPFGSVRQLRFRAPRDLPIETFT